MYGLESGEQYRYGVSLRNNLSSQHSKSRLHLKVYALPSNSARMMSGTIIVGMCKNCIMSRLPSCPTRHSSTWDT